MREIRRLPESVRHSVRSGIIFYDLTRVVEELIYNSLDASATKVSVTVGTGICFVKVADNGHGITREGLVLLGERYATSKFDNWDGKDDFNGSFGLRGESLSSMSDISLLEIVTRTHGRPHGYSKVMKGCKCLFLGIDDSRHDIGTTVTARDIFYNQPVRRKQVVSSPKKVLHSVKSCVLKIALVHPRVCFRLVATEDDVELLVSNPSSSPLSLLTSAFGNEASSSLHELDVSDGVLKLSGYISIPRDTISEKAFQYVYINSRYIDKGQIHKLLNLLAMNFSHSAISKPVIESPNGKRKRSEAHLTYLLNLSCPPSCYEINIEPSKATAEFKDWSPILSLIEKVVPKFWREIIYHDDAPTYDYISRKRNSSMRTHNATGEQSFTGEHSSSERMGEMQYLSSSLSLFSPKLGVLDKEYDHMTSWENDTPSWMSSRNVEQLEHESHRGVHQAVYSLKPYCELHTTSIIADQESDYETQEFDDRFFSSDNHLLGKGRLWCTRLENSKQSDDANISNVLSETELPFKNFVSCNREKTVHEEMRKPFLKSCSSQRGPQLDKYTYLNTNESTDVHGSRAKRKWFNNEDWIDPRSLEDLELDQRSCFSPRSGLNVDEATTLYSPDIQTSYDKAPEMNFVSRNSSKSRELDACHLKLDIDLHSDSEESMEPVEFFHGPFNSQWPHIMLDSPCTTKSQEISHIVGDRTLEVSVECDKRASSWLRVDNNFQDSVLCCNDDETNRLDRKYSSLSRKTSPSLNFERFRHKDNTCDSLQLQNLDKDIFLECSELYGLSSGKLWRKDVASRQLDGSCLISSTANSKKNENVRDCTQYARKNPVQNRRHGRSLSAPPSYRSKKKFFTLSDYFTIEEGNANIQTTHEANKFPEASNVTQLQNISSIEQHSEPNSMEEPTPYLRPVDKRRLNVEEEKYEVDEELKSFQHYHRDSSEDPFKEIEEPVDPGLKWRTGFPLNTEGEKSLRHEDPILNVTSGILHLAGDSLVPDSINRSILDNARVLQQVDKKFIPVVGGDVLALIDQHAADERIRLEDLRVKVLSGKMKTVAHLNAEQTLVLPEIGYQLLQNYAEQIKNWGWICNIHSQESESFKKSLNLLHRQASGVTLLAVPCILGVKLSDVDLLEFLQQLSDTDGSSSIPPSVHRVLNSKACRGAIMFGDTLLPSECSLIVEELKQTSQCFQCAHGRPTTVPLINLKSLHKQILANNLEPVNEGEILSWHGLRKHEVCLERAIRRLSVCQKD
ncbi:DNA mismatch repair protein MLH3 [Impatiens glandulifera]|uniref:DNA mismatch repair protein MLH3 n=1 Tax=Impatiens glandulifera TaxID=253017 RepID=UPI001FB0FE98|nr:DNA mismatch repair protein MLH3 [Impatiens glandulifera]